MDREKLEEILKKLNEIIIAETLIEATKIIYDIGELIEENQENLKITDSDKFIEVLKKCISNVEKKCDANNINYFYDNLDEFLIPLIDNDEKKIELLPKISDEYNKCRTIASLSDDSKKIELLSEVKRSFNKLEIIKSIKDDNIKMEFINTIEDESKRAKIVASLQDDEKKIKFLSELSDDVDKAEVIKSFRDDEKKIEFFSEISSDNVKALIIENFQLDANRIKALSKIDDDEAKAIVIKKLPDTEKIDLLFQLKSSKAQIEVISGIRNDDTKLELLSRFEQDDIKASIMTKIKDIRKKFLALEKLNAKSEEQIQKVILSVSDEKLEMVLSDSELSSKYEKLIEKAKRIRELKPDNPKEIKKYNRFGLPSEMTIGIEIEAEGEYAEPILKDLNYKTYDNWEKKEDGSLDKDKGLEISSPILHDNEETVNRIYEITTIMQELEFRATENCGGHVHIGANYLKSVEELKELLEIYGNTEKIFYYISNKAGELPRKGVKEYALPISGKIEQSELKNSKEDVFIEDAQKVQEERYSGINLMNMGINNVKNTVEFRLSNGTLNPEVWIENVRLYGKAVQMAHEIGQTKGKLKRGEQITEEEKHKLEIKETLKKEDIPDDEKMKLLMELLFDEKERKVYEERYEINKELDEKAHIVDSLSFGRVDFEDVYDSVGVLTRTVVELASDIEKTQTFKEK